jgi:hypothetical protein
LFYEQQCGSVGRWPGLPTLGSIYPVTNGVSPSLTTLGARLAHTWVLHWLALGTTVWEPGQVATAVNERSKCILQPSWQACMLPSRSYQRKWTALTPSYSFYFELNTIIF